jgi:ubiquinone/menaquinone biosynthesis C-methylase UbiE
MSLHTCPSWLSFSLDNPIRRRLQDPEAILSPHVRPGMTAIDIGCGLGYFTAAMARLAGPPGRVIAVDLQDTMLDRARARAGRDGVADRITFVKCGPEDLMVRDRADFVLAFWMVHEVRDREIFMRQVREIMKPGGRFLFVEPKLHVSRRQFEKSSAIAGSAGLAQVEVPFVRFSRAALFSLPA